MYIPIETSLHRNMIQRPGIREGSDMENVTSQRQSIKNRRSGIGNFTIIRPGAKRSAGVNRNIAFNRLSIIDSENAGVVELGEKTLAKLFEVKVPDPTDVTWLAEKSRLLAKYMAAGMTKLEAEREIKTNKPLGRAQRTLTKQQNIGVSNLSVGNKIAELKEEVDQGRVESKADQAVLTAELTHVFRGVRSLQGMTLAEFKDLKQIAQRSGIPSNRGDLGLDATYVDRYYYDANSGKINMLLIGKLVEAEGKGADAKRYNMNLIVRDFSKGSPDGLPAKSIASMYSALKRTSPKEPRYLDLDSGGLISQTQLQIIAGRYVNGFSDAVFAIRNPPQPITSPSAPSSAPPATPATPAVPAAPSTGPAPP